MKTVTLSATFDGQHIRLEEDYPLPKDARLLVTVLPAPAVGENQFRQGWYLLAAESLAGAYGPQEPDYTLGMLKETNPDYEGG